MRNIEIKARCSNLDAARDAARRLGGCSVAVLDQRDTFYWSAMGRLKLRRESRRAADGRLTERAELIAYERPSVAGPKASDYDLVPVADPGGLHEILARALGVRIEIIKTRELWMLDRTRIHLDEVEGLGSFIEFEVGVVPSDQEEDRHKVARSLIREFGLREVDLVSDAYADLLSPIASPPPGAFRPGCDSP